MEPPRSLSDAAPVVFMVDKETGLPVAPAMIVEVEPTLLGVAGGRLVSTSEAEARSTLFPTSMTLKLGEASALASLRNGCNARKDACDVMS